MRAALLSPELPEPLARLYDYQTGKFATPLDERGIADIDATFELAVRTFPDMLTPSDLSTRDKHHIYWTEEYWRKLAASQPSPDSGTIHEFRNSTPQIAYVPRVLHMWIEEVMTPPPPPSIEVMRRRNFAWKVASMLLQGAVEVDQARIDYDTKKHTTRRVLGWIDGITPVSQRGGNPIEERVNSEYWLSELNARLKGWKKVSDFISQVPAQDRIIPAARLATARSLHGRIQHGAIVPRVPSDLLLAA